MTITSIVICLFISLTLGKPVFVEVKENEITREVLPGMIFLPLFVLATVLFIVIRTTFQAIRDRRKRPLNSAEVVEQMTF
ncbi:hypothetical protein KM1_198670 [Entamoeba histolytica HM-3:IMSS]|uniref:Uncharacterized protein n=1 Tax=Entamoeba histolytica HM-3:IMSS TaxID=885315 RepID=M7WPH3_ENTHI|nr:hypothetical protein KM1_198670 [Entamoeba histolytica HM-3:IMSS]